MKPAQELLDVLSKAYPCPHFSGICKSMRWNPAEGHIPRGFLGATGPISAVELILVFAEPGDPHPGDHTDMDGAIAHAYSSFKNGAGLFHKNARKLFKLCWPNLTFDEQLQKVWLTESVLCSAERTTGPVPVEIERECATNYLKHQLALFPNALVVALGNKAVNRLKRMGVSNFVKAHSIAPPGCNQKAAYPSWVRISEILNQRRSASA